MRDSLRVRAFSKGLVGQPASRPAFPFPFPFPSPLLMLEDYVEEVVPLKSQPAGGQLQGLHLKQNIPRGMSKSLPNPKMSSSESDISTNLSLNEQYVLVSRSCVHRLLPAILLS